MAEWTYYSLTISEGGPSTTEVGRFLAELKGKQSGEAQHPEWATATWRSNIEGNCTRWPDCEEDMRAVSLHWPDVTFMMRGAGEDPNDEWATYHHGGRSYTEQRPEWIVPEFELEKLK